MSSSVLPDNLFSEASRLLLPHMTTVEERKFQDIIAAINDIRRAVILGEPGAGKTTTLWKLWRVIS